MKKSYAIVGLLIVSLLVLTACNLPFLAKATTAATQAPAVNTQAAPAQATQAPAQETQAPAQGTQPPAAALPSITSEPVKHITIPSEPLYNAAQITHDCNTGAVLGQSATLIPSGCDYWSRDWLERPADSATGTYDPALDIVWAQAGKSSPWLFFRIHVFDLSKKPNGLVAAIELDDDLDSRGEFLVLANQPASTDWTTDGVQVWQDKNGDVGGTKPFSPDTGKSDGYETQLFDSGVGSDPDLAWARLSPNSPNEIEFAVKSSLLANPNVFGWWGWVGINDLTPANMELVDHQQDAQTWNVDNICSWIYGITPKDNQLANLCPIFHPTPTPHPTNVPNAVCTPPPGVYCPNGQYQHWDPIKCVCVYTPG